MKMLAVISRVRARGGREALRGLARTQDSGSVGGAWLVGVHVAYELRRSREVTDVL
jgi:hypothetical protein